MKITIYNPSANAGGTNNLLANLAVLLSKQKQFDVHYVEFADGATVDFVRNNAQNCNILFIGKNEKMLINDGILIMILLHVKLINNRIDLDDKVRMLLWATHPDDAIKILPLFNFFYHKKRVAMNIISSIITPLQYKRIKRFMKAGITHDGVVWMDNHNYESADQFYKFNLNKKVIWPLITSEGKYKYAGLRENNFSSKIRIIFLGRMCDFKIIPILKLLTDMEKFKDKICLNFIGYGNYANILESNLKSKGFDYMFLGDVKKELLDKSLLQFDLLFGMGTSVLEGAKLGMPCVVMNGSYQNGHNEANLVDWLFNCPRYYIGEIVEKSANNPLQRTFSELLEEYENKTDSIAQACLEHFTKYHSTEALKKITMTTIRSNEFYFGENKKYLRLTIPNRIVNWVKNKFNKQ